MCTLNAGVNKYPVAIFAHKVKWLHQAVTIVGSIAWIVVYML